MLFAFSMAARLFKSPHHLKIMKKLLLCLSLLMTSTVFLSCVSVTTSDIPFSEETFKDDNDVIIYVYRLKSLVGAAVPWAIRLDGKVVAILKQNAYTVIHTTPGVHTVLVGDSVVTRTGSGGLIDLAIYKNDVTKGTFETRRNESYYVRSKGFNVSVVSKEEAMPDLENMHPAAGM